MEGINIVEELKVLDKAIGKKMFNIKRIEEVETLPSPLQFNILGFLLENRNKNICQKTLEMNFNVSKATISGALLTMEKNGIITRNTSETDAREKHIELTELSKKRFKELEKLNEMINKELKKNISEDDLNVFLKVIKNMTKNIEGDYEND